MKNTILLGLMAALPALAVPNPRINSDKDLYNACMSKCNGQDGSCRKQPGHDPLTCRKDLANCVLICDNDYMPGSQCVNNCMIVDNNCVSQVGANKGLCQSELNSCLGRCK